MAELPHLLPPHPVSRYLDHQRYDWYYKRRDGKAKSGQTWDMFDTWGQQHVVGDGSFGNVVVPSASRIPMTYHALTPCIPTVTPNRISSDFVNPGVKMRRDQSSLWKMRDDITLRMSKCRVKKYKYSDDVRRSSLIAQSLQSEIKKSQKATHSPQKGGDNEALAASSPVQADDSHSSKRIRSTSESDCETDPISGTEAVSPDSINSRIGAFTGENSELQRIYAGLHRDPRLLRDVTYPVIPVDYLGGCISTKLSGSDYNMAYVTGPHLSKVRLRKMKRKGVFSKLSSIASHDHGETVKQLELECYGNTRLLAARSRSKVTVYSSEVEDDAAVTVRHETSTSDPRFVTLNPYYPEALIVHNDLTVHRWSEHSQAEQIVEEWSSRFHVDPDTRTVQYGCHPQQLVLTDPAACSLYDVRSRSTCVDLFEVPGNSLLHTDERLVTSLHGRDFTHHILSHHTLLTVDERFPKYPMIYQVLPCLTYPMLLDTVQLGPTSDLITLGCASNQEVFSLIVDSKLGNIRTSPVWKISETSDMCYLDETRPPGHLHSEAISRLSDSSLIGLSASRLSDQSFTIHLLNGSGDLFEQTYEHDDADGHTARDITLSAGPLIDKPTDLKPAMLIKCQAWYTSLSTQLSSGGDVACEADSTDTITLPNLTKSKKHCSLCKGMSMPPEPSQMDTQCDVESSRCDRCGYTETESWRIQMNLMNNKMTDLVNTPGPEDNEPHNIFSFNPAERAGTDANSRLLLKLWNNEDIDDTLTERDKEWDERSERLTSDARLYEGTIRSSEWDAISCITGASRASAANKSQASSTMGARSTGARSTGARSVKGARSVAGSVSSSFKKPYQPRSPSPVQESNAGDLAQSLLPSSLFIDSTPTSAQKKNRTKQSRKGF